MSVKNSLQDIVRVRLTDEGMEMLKDYLYVHEEGTSMATFQVKGRPRTFRFTLLQLLLFFGGEDLKLALETDQKVFVNDEIVLVKKKK